MGLAKRTCRGAALLHGGTLGGAPVTPRGGTLGGAAGTLRDYKRVSESCWRAWFKGVAVGVNGGARPVCVMAWMRSLAAAALRSKGGTYGMVYVEGKKATLLLLRHALVAGM